MGENMEGGGGRGGSEYCNKIPDVPNHYDRRSRSDSAPATGRGGERERGG